MNDEQTQAMEIVKDSPKRMMRQATDVAGVCRDIVRKTAVNIQGRSYVKAEGWLAVAIAHGCIAGARDVERITGGFRAIGEVKRISDGLVLSTAEGFVGDDETTWAKRPEYAKRAMAQTRAISRACRSAFAHVVVLIDSNLSTTPAEEVPPGGFIDVHPEPARQATPSPQPHVNGSRLVLKDCDTKTGTSARGPWTMFIARFSDGTEATTFDKKVGEQLEVLKGHAVNARIQPGKKEGKFDLMAIGPDMTAHAPGTPEHDHSDDNDTSNSIPF